MACIEEQKREHWREMIAVSMAEAAGW